jgi:hypothetical protein
MTATPAIPNERIPDAIKRLLFILLFAFAVMPLNAQQMIGFLELNGRAKKAGKDLPGATVTLYRNGVKQKEIITGRNGKFRFDIDFGADYKITFSAPGCVDMHLLVFASTVPKEKYSIFPIYDIEVPFFDVNDKTIRIEKYKKPFTKIVFDGNRTFRDDEKYLEEFVKDIHIDPDEIQKQIEEKERLEREKLLAIEKEKERLAREKLLAEEKARLELEEKLRADELARLKRENEEKMKEIDGVSMETDAIRLQREKEEKAITEKKNRGIKSTYESELLKTVAENERLAKEKEIRRLKTESQTNAVIEKIKRETEVKAKSEYLREQEKERNKKALQNKQIKSEQVKKLVEAAAFADRSVKVNNQVRLPDPDEYKPKKLPNVAVSYDEEFLKSVSTVTVTSDRTVVIFKKEIYTWGSIYYYKNDVEISEEEFKKEVIKYGPYTPKQ